MPSNFCCLLLPLLLASWLKQGDQNIYYRIPNVHPLCLSPSTCFHDCKPLEGSVSFSSVWKAGRDEIIASFVRKKQPGPRRRAERDADPPARCLHPLAPSLAASRLRQAITSPFAKYALTACPSLCSSALPLIPPSLPPSPPLPPDRQQQS